MCVIFMTNYFLVGGDVSVDSKMLLVTDFVNFKIKPTQSFRDAYMSRIYVCVYIVECSYVYEYLRFYIICFANDI
jgi:hypothetical protein